MSEKDPSERRWIMRKTKMSKGAVMLFELLAADLYNQSEHQTVSDDFFQLFTGLVSCSESTALDLNRAWEESALRLRRSKKYFNEPPAIMDANLAGINLNFNKNVNTSKHC